MLIHSSPIGSRRHSGLVATLVAFVGLLATSATAQWPPHQTPGIPRLPDGKPNLFAPVPRASDGRPDLSGIWGLDKGPFKYLRDITADFKPGESPTQPWAEALTKERMTGAHASESPPARCLTPGIPIMDSGSAAGYPLNSSLFASWRQRVGTRCFSSSFQLSTTVIGEVTASVAMFTRNRCPSRLGT